MRQALMRLQAAAEAGALASLCHRYDVSLLVVFGSVLDAAVPEPRDLDVAVRFSEYDPAKVLPLLDEVARLAGINDVGSHGAEHGRPGRARAGSRVR